MDIANRLYELRKAHSLSQDELADKLNVSRQAVSKWERGESYPDTNNLIALAQLYKMSIDDLLGYEPEIKSEQSVAQDTTQQKITEDEVEEGILRGVKNAADKFFDKINSALDGVEIDTNPIHDDEDDDWDDDWDDDDDDNDDDDDDWDDDGAFHIHNNGETIHIGKDGIRVGEKVVIDKNGIVVNGKVVDGNKVYHSKPSTRATLHAVIDGSIFLACTIAYILMGCLANLWHPAWIIFFLIPIAPGIVHTITSKNPNHLPIPLIVTAIYLVLGCVLNLWHPSWVIFFTIPLYYSIVNPIYNYFKNRKRNR